jgi:ethanolamine utilization protein EutA
MSTDVTSDDRLVYAAGQPDHEYVHDHDALSPLEDNPIWQQDNVTLRSVGIDIGSSGTQVVFSRLRLRRIGQDLTSRYVVVERTSLYRSPVRFTPYQGEQLIDAEGLGSIIDDAYAAARQHPDGVDTGVVILTGEAVRRRNAGRIADVVATTAGELVCAAAGHHMEAMLAAYGSGAAKASYDAGNRILNVDMGGGTTKLALVERGRVIATAAVHIGGRLQVVDNGMRIVRLEATGRELAARAGFTWSTGDVVRHDQLDTVAETMADALVAAVTTRPLPRDVAGLYLTRPIDDLGDVAGVMFSGGVAEYVYGRETREFGDLGRRLGLAVARWVGSGSLPFPLLAAGECIRATVLGASEYTVQLSGNTSYISSPDDLLPRRNLQVVGPDYPLGEVVDPDVIATAIRDHLSAFDLGDADADVALALRWSGVPSYERLLALAQGVRRGLANRISRGLPVFITLDGDVAHSLGSILRDELGVDSGLLVIDGLNLWDFDYIDLGRVRFPSNTVPVTIKSLVFNDAQPPDSSAAMRGEEHDPADD